MNEEQYDDKCPCCGRLYDEEPPKKRRKAPVTDFDAFWSAYPKKIAKPYCKAIWDRKGLTLDMVIPALTKAIASRDWQKDGGQFIPNPSTWLNQGRWEDEGLDYTALKVEKPTITSRLGVNEEEAFAWRVEIYPESMLVHPTPDTFPFKAWPKSTQQEYLNSITNHKSE
jgi:hypothetical protein